MDTDRKCMINGYAIRKCDVVVCISIPTSFFWRNKILDAIRSFMGVGSVGEVIEVDEAFYSESFKGDHRNSTCFTLLRKAHKRGVKGSSIVKMKFEKEVYQRNKLCSMCCR